MVPSVPVLQVELLMVARTRSAPSLAANLILAQSAVTAGVARVNSALPTTTSSRAIFDSDSFDILVDGSVTACISNNLNAFIKPPRDSTIRVKGFNVTTSATKIGTVRWHVLDDSGREHAIQVPNTYYVPACQLRLLSPQHYSQATKDLRGTYSTNFGDQVIFVWDHSRFKATMPLSAATNVGILRSAPGHKVFTSFVDLNPGATTEPQAFFCSAVVSDSEADDLESDADDEATFSRKPSRPMQLLSE
jgi:hypothetical protein